MSASKLHRPIDEDYYVEPWSDTFLQGDLFKDVPVAIPAPPDARAHEHRHVLQQASILRARPKAARS